MSEASVDVLNKTNSFTVRIINMVKAIVKDNPIDIMLLKKMVEECLNAGNYISAVHLKASKPEGVNFGYAYGMALDSIKYVKNTLDVVLEAKILPDKYYNEIVIDCMELVTLIEGLYFSSLGMA